MLHKNKDGALEQGAVHGYFGLSYASYLVIPRVALDAMPLAWQERFVDLMQEAEEIGLETPDDYVVQCRGVSGKFVKDPWAKYRHPDPEVMKALEKVLNHDKTN